MMSPRVSMGTMSPMQDRVLANTMRSKLGEIHELVPVEETAALMKAATAATEDPTCSTHACLGDLRTRAGATHSYSLEILRDPSGTQLVVHVSSAQGSDSRSKFCAGCDTEKLDESLGAITAAMAQASRPIMAASVPAIPGMMQQPAAPATSIGQELVGSAVDIVAECAAKIAAEQACSIMPSFAGTACKIGVNIKFKGSLCP